MADPLRRTLLAKLRGKKAKKVRSGSRQEAGEGNSLVSRARNAQSPRADLDYVPGAMRGKQGCVHGGLERRYEPPCARAHSGQGGDPSASGFGVRDELKLSKKEMRIGPEAHGATKQPVPFPRRHTEGDSIGFGTCSELPFSYGAPINRLEPVFKTKITNPGRRKELEMEQHNSSGRAEPGKLDSSDPSHFFQYLQTGCLNEHDLIRTLESSLQLSGDYSMPALQNPTFFPTELEIIDADLGPRLVCPRESATRHNSVDSEDEDYYDNEILPYYEPMDGDGPARASQSGSIQVVDSSIQESDMLRTRLKEAYYLLINAMDGIVFDGQMQPNSYPEQSCSSSQSHDSLSVGSQSSTRHSRSSGEHGGHLWTPLSPDVTSPKSKSLENLLTAQGRPRMRRSVSDGGVKYSEPNRDSARVEAASYYDPAIGRKPSTDVGAAAGTENAEKESDLSANNPEPLEGSGKPDLASFREPRLTAAGGAGKPPGVTVNKMQEWMHKGRLLSSEMRHRIAGSSSHGPEGQTLGKTFSTASGNKLGIPKSGFQPSAGTTSGGKTPVLSIPSPSSVLVMEPRESCTRLAPPMNTITVSKKRNWLTQSSTRSSPPTDDDDLTPPLPSRLHTHTLSDPDLDPDPTEENDADDEGEIWYNPIPEDEEEELPHRKPVPRVPRHVSVGDGGGASRASGDSGNVNPELSFVYKMCRTYEEKLPIRPTAAEPSDPSLSGLSPPSSPNPAKKSCSINWSLPERIKSPRTVRKLSMKMKKLPELSRKLSVKGQPDPRTHLLKAADLGSSGVTSGNVIWRYHLDSSVSTQQKKSDGLGAPKSAIKGGYLSDGDSPELVAKSGKHSSKSHRKAHQEKDVSVNPKLADLAAFRPYSLPEQGKCAPAPPVSGLLSVHLCGAEGLKTPRNDDSRHVYCAIQVDEAKRARTALLPCQADFLAMDHTFQLELEEAQRLRLILFGCEATTEPRKQRVCSHGAVALAAFFRTPNGTRAHKLAVRLEPRGVIYVKLGLTELRQSLTDGNDGDKERDREVFGTEAARVVEREATGLMVPLIIEKCIGEIERRGCQVVGLYRLCGSAAVKKELREEFERNSHAVELSESNYPDINVITGVLKDYLRELPQPLISKPLYEAVLDAMAKRPLVIGSGGCENDKADSDHATGLLETLPEVERATLRKLLDHLKRVASHHEANKMTCQNLAVCFGPVLLSQRQDASGLAKRVFVDSEELASALHFKKHIEVLHYLLQLWPVVGVQGKPSTPAPDTHAPVRRRKERPQVLNLGDAGVLRPRAGRLDSPSNRYAGDWSDCRETYLGPRGSGEADYADVPSEGDEEGEGVKSEREAGGAPEKAGGRQTEAEKESGTADVSAGRAAEMPVLVAYEYERRSTEHAYQALMKIQKISPVLSNRVNLRDLQESIDALIGNLERELSKNKVNVDSYREPYSNKAA